MHKAEAPALQEPTRQQAQTQHRCRVTLGAGASCGDAHSTRSALSQPETHKQVLTERKPQTDPEPRDMLQRHWPVLSKFSRTEKAEDLVRVTGDQRHTH